MTSFSLDCLMAPTKSFEGSVGIFCSISVVSWRLQRGAKRQESISTLNSKRPTASGSWQDSFARRSHINCKRRSTPSIPTHLHRQQVERSCVWYAPQFAVTYL